MGPETGFDVSDRNAANEPSQGTAERAGRVPLHHKQVGPGLQQRTHAVSHLANVVVRVLFSGTIQLNEVEAAQAEIVEAERRVLTREDERRPTAKSSQRMRNRGHLDGFRSGANHQPDIGETQYSP